MWTGKIGECKIDSGNIHDLVRKILTRSQLRDASLIYHANPNVSMKKILLYTLLNESSSTDPTTLARYGLIPLPGLSAAEEARIACRDRSEFEAEVIEILRL